MNEAVARGDLKTAYKRIRETNPLLGTTARCCPQLSSLCESACALQWVGHPVAIGMIQRAVADWERLEQTQPPPARSESSGKKIAIVGAGPAGLGAAELLTRYGHSATIYEELQHSGGTAWYGIPDYHLPKDVLDYEVEKIVQSGVEIKNGVKIGRDLTLSELLEEGYGAVIVATGCKDIVALDTPGKELSGVYEGYTFLEDVYVNGVDAYLKNPTYKLGKETLVIGGGDSALDAARTALRLTGGKVTLVYRRTEKEMPADSLVVEEAKEEGVDFKFLAAPRSFNGSDGRLTSVTMITMELGPPDASGRRSPQPVPGRDFEMICDSVIVSVGRGPNSFLQKKENLKTGKNNSIAINEHYETSIPRVFAAGDVTSGETLVVKALQSGRQAAQRVHESLSGLEGKHVSLYQEYFSHRRYPRLFSSSPKAPLPPP